MPVIHLIDHKLQLLRTDRSQEDFWDESLPGFGVRVTRQGKKTFVLMFYANGTKRRTTLGSYPSLSLAAARDQTKGVLYDVARGKDPQALRQAEKMAKTFEQLATEFLDRHSRRNKRSWREDKRILRVDLLPRWRNRKAKEISRRDVVALLDSIVERGAPVMANRTRALVSKIVNFGLGRDVVQHNPCHGVPTPGKEAQRDRVLTEAEIAAVWRILDSEGPVIAATFKVRLLSAQRGQEVLSMSWKDLDGSWWTIPGDDAKNGLSHRVPLSPQVRAVIEGLRPVTGKSQWVFASARVSGSHVTAVQKAAERISKASRVSFVSHDLRRTAASLLAPPPSCPPSPGAGARHPPVARKPS